MNKQHTIFIIGLITLSVIIIPYSIYFMGSIEGSSESSTEEDDNYGEKDKFLPNLQNQIKYISNVEYIKGENSSINDLNKLKLDDGDNYEIRGTFDVVEGYEFDIRFYFDIDLSNNLVDFYDILLYFETDFSTNAEILTFQANTSMQWNTLANISLSPIKFERKDLDNCLGFRINGSTTLQKRIPIDFFYVMLLHNGTLDLPQLSIESFDLIRNKYNVGWDGAGMTQLITNDNWWILPAYDPAHPSDPYDDLMIRSLGHNGGGSSSTHYGWVQDVITLNYDIGGGTITNIKIDNLEMHFQTRIRGTGSGVGASGIAIYNWNTTNYNDHRNFGAYGSMIYFEENYNTLDIQANWYDYFKQDSGLLSLRYQTNCSFDRSTCCQWYDVWLEDHYAVANITLNGFDFPYWNYPEISDIYTIPDSEISPIGDPQFSINADIYPHYSYKDITTTISNVNYLIQNSTWNSGWLNMPYDSGNSWRKLLNTVDFENGNYTLWIQAEDSLGLITYDYYEFSIQNARPRISIITPNFLEEIIQLYNYNVNISIFEPEGEEYWTFGSPQIKIYENNESEPIIDWMDMQQYNPILPQYWNFTFNPVDFENGIYTLKFRANDSIDYGYNETMIVINNNPPNIEIISPSLTELKIPFIQKIECNISNEEPINIAQWDLVKVLGDYAWKSLSYNISMAYYESSFNLLDYQYGDYYLVINATDDKYNSTIKTKQLKLHPLLTYNIGIPQITYKNKGIEIYTNPDDTTDITAQFNIEHHPIAQERDFEIYIPDNYEDAFDYYINRGFNTYEPIGFTNEGIYTLWYIPEYQSADIVHFQLEKPKLTNDISGVLEKEDGSYELVFTLTAKHSFTALTIKHSLTQYFAHPENYEYILEYKYEGDWKEYNGDLEVDAGAFINFEFSWASIDSNSTLEFRFSAIPLEIQETNLTAWLIFGGVSSAIGAVVWVLFGGFAFKKYVDWGKGKFILVSIAVIGISFGIGFGIGLLAYPNPV